MKTPFLVLPILILTTAFAETPAPANPPPAKEPPPIVLEPFVLNAESELSFGFGIRVMRNQATRHALGMSVERVGSGTDAERKGLKSQSQIIAINGKPVGDYEATFNAGSELGKIFVGRAEGAKVTLTVIPFGKKKPQTLTIVRRTIYDHSSKIGGLPD